VSFSYSATVTKPAEVKAALEHQRDALGRTDAYAADRDPTGLLRGELDDLTAAAVKALEGAVRGLPGRGTYRLSVSGTRNADGDSVSLSVTTPPAG
jgi:hypothetical protein